MTPDEQTFWDAAAIAAMREWIACQPIKEGGIRIGTSDDDANIIARGAGRYAYAILAARRARKDGGK